MKNYKGKRFADKNYSKDIKNKKKQLSKEQKDTNNINKNKKKSGILFNLITIVCIIAIIFSLYNIFNWIIDNRNNNSLLSNIHEQTHITQEQVSVDGTNINKLHYDFTNLLSYNKNTVGWIHMQNSNIDYPVVRYTDNDYYLNHSFNNTENTAGWVFTDYRNKCDNSDYNTVIYGHNRKDKSMFGSLKNVLEADWYSNEENLYINFSTLNENHVYKIFSTFVCNDKDVSSYLQTNFSSKEEFNLYIQKLKNTSSHNFDINLDDTEQIITLYTCYGLNNQRLLVCAKLVD